MDLDRLREYMMVAEEKSFKKAAERIGIPSNVLSTRIRGFEKSLNTELVIRTKNGIKLTETGKALLPKADMLLKSYTHAANLMDDLKNHTFQSLNLQFCANKVASEVGPYLDIFCRKHPQMILHIYDENACMIEGGLKTGKVDICFVICRENDFRNISGRVLLSYFSNMYVHLPLDHPLAHEKEVHFSDLSGETFILYPNMLESWTHDLQISILDQSGIDYEIYDESTSPLFFDLLVPIGKGIRLWNWREEIAPNTVLLPIADKGYDTYLYMLYDKNTTNPAVIPFISGLLEHRSNRK